MLKRLYVDNVRCLSNFELVPGPVSVLVGGNGTGKTTVWEVLEALLLGVLRGDGVPFGAGTRTAWDDRPTQSIEIEVQQGQELFKYSLDIEHDERRRTTVIGRERLLGNGQLLYQSEQGQVQLFGDDAAATPRAAFPVDRRRSFLPVLEPNPDNSRIHEFKRWVANVWMLRLLPEFDSFSREEGQIATRGANFVSWYRRLLQEDPNAIARVQEDLRPVITGLEQIRFQTVGDAKLLVCECKVAGKSFQLPVGQLSDGQRALLVYYTMVRAVASRASLLVLDEPDNYLAEGEIQPLLAELRGTMARSAQGSLMVMSHHPEVIDYLAADQVLSLTRDGSGPTRIQTVAVEREQGIKASEWLRLKATNDAAE